LHGSMSSRLTIAPMFAAAIVAVCNVCGCVAGPVRIATLWPASTVNYWLRMRRVRPADFTLQRLDRAQQPESRNTLEGAAS